MTLKKHALIGTIASVATLMALSSTAFAGTDVRGNTQSSNFWFNLDGTQMTNPSTWSSAQTAQDSLNVGQVENNASSDGSNNGVYGSQQSQNFGGYTSQDSKAGGFNNAHQTTTSGVGGYQDQTLNGALQYPGPVAPPTVGGHDQNGAQNEQQTVNTFQGQTGSTNAGSTQSATSYVNYVPFGNGKTAVNGAHGAGAMTQGKNVVPLGQFQDAEKSAGASQHQTGNYNIDQEQNSNSGNSYFGTHQTTTSNITSVGIQGQNGDVGDTQNSTNDVNVSQWQNTGSLSDVLGYTGVGKHHG